MRRRQLNQPPRFSPAPSQLPIEGQAKSAAGKSLENPSRRHLRAELAATHGAGQDSSPGQAVHRQPAGVPPTSAVNLLTSNMVALPRLIVGEGTKEQARYLSGEGAGAV